MRNSALKRQLVKIYEYVNEGKRLLDLRINYHLRIMTSDQTLRYIEKHNCSIARFGDGEFDHILGNRDEGYQKRSLKLSKELSDVLKNKNKNLLLCVPHCLNTVKDCNEHASNFWIEWGRHNDHHKEVVEMIWANAGKRYIFGDTLITRPYIDWKSGDRARKIFPKLQHLWENKDVIIVEGEQTRLGVGNDLFDNTRSLVRIICPATGAYEYKKAIKETILKYYNGQLILMALGPTATILASEFSEMDIQALDLGHIDIEYEWFLRGAKERIPIPGKYTNEAKDGVGRVFTDCEDEKYLSQIAARVGC